MRAIGRLAMLSGKRASHARALSRAMQPGSSLSSNIASSLGHSVTPFACA